MTETIAIIIIGCAVLICLADSLCNLIDPPDAHEYGDTSHTFRKA